MRPLSTQNRNNETSEIEKTPTAVIRKIQRLESKGVGYVSYQEQWLDSTGPFKDVMISMFATLAKQERARISERTIAGLKVARAKGKRLGRPPLPEKPFGPFFR